MGYTRATTVSVHWYLFRLSSEALLLKPSIRLEIWHHLQPPKTDVWEFVQAFSVINSFKKGSGLHFDGVRFLTSRSLSKRREWRASSRKTNVMNETKHTKHSFEGRCAVPNYPSKCVPLSVKLLTIHAKWY